MGYAARQNKNERQRTQTSVVELPTDNYLDIERSCRERLQQLDQLFTPRNIHTHEAELLPRPTFIDLLLEHGRLYFPKPLPAGPQRDAPKECFFNAWKVTLKNQSLRYAEGFAFHTSLWLPILHGFVVDDTHAYECTKTIADPEFYFGVELNPSVCLTKTGFQSISDAPWCSDHAVALKRWERAFRQPAS